MKILRFVDVNQTIDVSYKTDLISDNQSNFTVLSIDGLSSAEEKFGFQFKQLPTNVNAFKAFALANDLKLTSLYLSHSTDQPVVLQDFTNIYNNGGLGLDNI